MRRNKLWNIRFVHLLLVEAVFQFATYLLNPVISSYVVLLGSSLAVGGFVAGLVASAALAMRPFTGWIADKLSKTTLLVLAAALFTVAAFGCAAVSSVFWIGVFRIVQGVAFAFRSAVVVSLASVVVAHDHVGRAVGWVGVVTTVSCAVAPTLAAFMGTTVGYHACFFVSGSLFFVGLVLAVLFKLPKDVRTHHRAAQEQAREAKGRVPAGFRLRDFLYLPAIPYSVMAALSGVPHGINVSLMLSVGDARGIPGVSLYFTLYALAALASKPLAGRLCDTKGFHAVFVPVVLVGVAVLVFMDSLVLAAVAGVLVGVGQGSAYSALQAEAVRGANVEELGRAANTFYIGPDINMGMSPFVGGFVMQTGGVTALYAVCFVLVFCTLLLFLAIRRRADPTSRGF